MEFSFNVNDMLPDLITLVDEKLAPFRSRVKNDRFEFASKQNQLKILIDKMGEASTRAQGLRTPITSAIKLQNSDYRLYIMKDPSANNGLGAAVGILKVGHKRLFLLDMQSVQYEVYPLCVLDFYVHESRQRTGCGKRLFEHMMKMEGKMVHHLAIDRPSTKFVSFLKKYYGLKNAIPQANNFVIHEHFFSDLQAVGHMPRRSQRLAQNSVQSGRPPVHPYMKTGQSVSEPSPLRRRPSASSSQRSTRPNSDRRLSSVSNNSTHSKEEAASDMLRINDSLQHINIPHLVPRPSSRSSAPGSRGSSAGRRSAAMELELGNTEATNHARSEAYNASRGLAARATSYSRHSNRGVSASIAKSNSIDEAMVTSSDNNIGFSRSNSGGRIRSLHVTSSENPFVGDQVVTRKKPSALQEPQKQLPQARNELDQFPNTANTQIAETMPAQSGVNSTGSFSVDALFKASFGERRPPFLGTSWNIFGVPTYTKPESTSDKSLSTRRNTNRHHPL